jgi:hypothetical protein
MPFRNPFSRKYRPTPPLRSVSRLEGSESGQDLFTLPTSTKEVEEQLTVPKQLPAPNADTDEVRYFLYHVLTYKGNKVARRWPQWVLETCAYWTGTGAELRGWSKDFQLLVPKSAGHAELDKRSRHAERPDGDCRLAIAEVMEKTVKRMIAEENGAAVNRQEWIARQRGRASSQDYYRSPLFVPSASEQLKYAAPTDFPMISQAPSFISARGSQQLPSDYAPSMPAPNSIHRKPSMPESMFVNRVANTDGSSDTSPISSGGSGITNSTDKTTPRVSAEEDKGQPKRYAKRPQPLHSENVQRRPSRTPSVASSSAFSSAESYYGIPEVPRVQVYAASDCDYMDLPENIPTQSPSCHAGMHAPWVYDPPRSRSISTVHSGSGGHLHTSRSVQDLYMPEQSVRHASPVASARSFTSHIARSTNPVPHATRPPPISMTSLNYPRPDISHTRQRSAPSAVPFVLGSQPRHAAPSMLHHVPPRLVYHKPRIQSYPSVPSLAGSVRSQATAGVDQFALQLGAYHQMRLMDPAKAYEVAITQ